MNSSVATLPSCSSIRNSDTIFTVVLNADRFADRVLEDVDKHTVKVCNHDAERGKLETMDEGQTTICRDDLAHLDF